MSDLRSRNADLEARVAWLECLVEVLDPALSHISTVDTGQTLPIHAPAPHQPETSTSALPTIPSTSTRQFQATCSSPSSRAESTVIARPEPTSITGLVQTILAFPGLELWPPSSAGIFHLIPLTRLAADDLDKRDDTRQDSPSPQPLESTLSVPGLPPLETTLGVCRNFVTRYMQPHIVVSIRELEQDANRIYRPGGMANPRYAASRFRCFMVLYLSGQSTPSDSALHASDGAFYRSLALKELAAVTAREDLVSLLCSPFGS